MATFIFACAACGAQVVCDNACRKYCNGCKDEVRKARMRNYYHAGLRGTIIGSESKCAGCDGSFTRVSSRQKFCPPCGREKRRMDTIIWKEKVGYSNKRPNAKTRIGDMIVCGGCATTFRKRVTYEKYCDECKKSIQHHSLPRPDPKNQGIHVVKALARNKEQEVWPFLENILPILGR